MFNMSHIIDDKSEHCIPFILDQIKTHRQQYEARGETPTPFFVGLNGVQGAGKTTLVGHFLPYLNYLIHFTSMFALAYSVALVFSLMSQFMC